MFERRREPAGEEADLRITDDRIDGGVRRKLRDAREINHDRACLEASQGLAVNDRRRAHSDERPVAVGGQHHGHGCRVRVPPQPADAGIGHQFAEEPPGGIPAHGRTDDRLETEAAERVGDISHPTRDDREPRRHLLLAGSRQGRQAVEDEVEERGADAHDVDVHEKSSRRSGCRAM